MTEATDQALIDHFEEQAGWNDALGSPFTAGLVRAMGQDFSAGGPVATLCRNWPGNPRKDATSLRLAGALHHAVLTGTAHSLAAVYPASRPDWSMAEVWPLARNWLEANRQHVADFIKRPPQTNETRRAMVLLPGFLELAARFDMPMDLLELGASAGLNQNWDRFGYSANNWQKPGMSDVLIRTKWTGPPPAHLEHQPQIRSRAACDLNPLNVSDPAAALKLKAYTWADQTERLVRLDAAIRLGIQTGVKVEEADAEEWLAGKLAMRASTGLTVIFHSIFLIYPPREQIIRIMKLIRQAGGAATEKAPLAWLCYESESLFGGDKSSPRMRTRLQVWPEGDTRFLTESDGHITYVKSLTQSG